MTEFEPVERGQIVPVDISLWPMSMRFRKGEQFRLQIAGYNMRGAFLPGIPEAPNENRGTHILHTGGQYDSHLLLPFSR
uniref:CocE/NonD family hydrolase C-terminal non-catalytic domain-containing protein n=1 Tax=Gordonia westfalica TaxID=158898 RepID=UPI0035C81A13